MENLKTEEKDTMLTIGVYRDLLEMALVDGVLDEKENDRLDIARKKYGVSMDEHISILRELQSENRIESVPLDDLKPIKPKNQHAVFISSKKLRINKQRDNQERRRLKKIRVNIRKENGTYVKRKHSPTINKWGKPYYVLEEVIVPWKKSGYVWINSYTNETIYGLKPSPYIYKKWVSTGQYSDIKPVRYTTNQPVLIEKK